jgi:hypothetical protein
VPAARMFRGVDKYQASRTVQSGDNWGNHPGGQIDGADAPTPARRIVDTKIAGAASGFMIYPDLVFVGMEKIDPTRAR